MSSSEVTESMVERVARAICASDFDGDVSVYDTMSDAMRENFTINARAAIEAMMVPTPQMLKAGIDDCATSIRQDRAGMRQMTTPFEDECKSIWQAMIRSSLNGESK